MSSTFDEVVDRLDDLGSATLVDVTVPDIATLRRSRHRPTRWPVLAAAASVILAVVVGVTVWGDHDTDILTADGPKPTVDAGPRLVPTEWPPELNGDVVASDPADTGGWVSERSWLLAHDGHAAAIATVDDFPLRSGTPVDPNEVSQDTTVAGRAALYRLGGSGQFVSVGLDVGRTLTVASQVTDRAELEAAAAAVVAALDDDTGVVDRDRLRNDWTVLDDEAGLASSFMTGGPTPADWHQIRRESATVNASQQVIVGARRVQHADAAIADVRSLYPDAQTVDMGNGVDGLLRPLPMLEGAVVVWAPDGHTIASATGLYLSGDQLVATARSVREVSATEWSQMRPETRATQTVDGVTLPADWTVVDSGHHSDFTWIVSISEPRSVEGPGHETPAVTSVSLRSDDGEQGNSSGSGGSGYSPGTNVSRGGGFVVLFSDNSPIGLTDAHVMLDDAPLDSITVDVPQTQRTLVFAVLPARSTPEIDSSTTWVVGTLPDGTAYDSRTPPG